MRWAGVGVARLQSVLDALQVFLPGVFVVVVVWLGARFAVQGRISPGELVAFYGYAAFLTMPLRTATEAANKWIRAHVSSRRIVRVLALRPEVEDPTSLAEAPPKHSVLVDVASGLRLEPRRLTAVVAEPPDEAARVVDRLGRYVEGHVVWGGVPLSSLPRSVIRERIVVSDTGATLFSGPLGAQLDVHGDGDVAAALHTAAAEDVLEALPEGLATTVAEKGRSFSGGQRQRLVLARVLAADPEVLLLVEPTSAVDAHTEARIADRIVAARAGPDHPGDHLEPAGARPGRRRGLPARRPGRRPGIARRPAGGLDPAYRAVVTREEAGGPRLRGRSAGAPMRKPNLDLQPDALPVATGAEVGRYLRGLVRRHPRPRCRSRSRCTCSPRSPASRHPGCWVSSWTPSPSGPRRGTSTGCASPGRLSCSRRRCSPASPGCARRCFGE